MLQHSKTSYAICVLLTLWHQYGCNGPVPTNLWPCHVTHFPSFFQNYFNMIRFIVPYVLINCPNRMLTLHLFIYLFKTNSPVISNIIWGFLQLGAFLMSFPPCSCLFSFFIVFDTVSFLYALYQSSLTY